MPQYVVLAVDGDEDAWETAPEETKQRTYDADGRFIALLEERGGKVVGGADLDHSRLTRVLQHAPNGDPVVTDGPYAETVEQLSGFYIVDCDDIDALTEAALLMLPGHTRLEIRPRPAKDAS